MKGSKLGRQEAQPPFVYGYFGYPDGMSCWGINLLRYGRAGVEIPLWVHKQDRKFKRTWLRCHALIK